MNYLQSINTSKCQKYSNVNGIRRHTLKLEKPGCNRYSRKFFLHRMVGCWNKLHQEMADASNVNAFNGRLDKVRLTRLNAFVR